MKLFVVIVLYKMEINCSKTYLSLRKAVVSCHDILPDISLLIYDNSPQKQTLRNQCGIDTHYVHDQSNGGLSQAYNFAWKEALRYECPWMLLLDQDTDLPDDFISNLYATIKLNSSCCNVVSIVPKVICNNKIISPGKEIFGGRIQTIARTFIGKCDFPVMAINSGTLIKTAFITEIGGFSRLFKLDFLDYWLFNRIYRCGRCVYVSESILDHELSVSNFDKYITVQRYEQILIAEGLYYQINKSRVENIIYVFRLIVRAIKRLIVVKDKRIGIMIFKYCGIAISKVCIISKTRTAEENLRKPEIKVIK